MHAVSGHACACCCMVVIVAPPIVAHCMVNGISAKTAEQLSTEANGFIMCHENLPCFYLIVYT